MTITTTFDPPLPSDTPAVFDTKAFTLLGDLNDWSTEANALAVDVNAKEATATTAATTASTAAGTATSAAATATTKASEAVNARDDAVDAQAAAEAAAAAAATFDPALYVAKAGGTMIGPLTVPSLNSGQLAGLRNKVINGNFGINQRAYVSGAATTAGQYTLDRWKVTGTGGVTFSTTANKTTVTIPIGQTLQQVIEGLNLESGTYVLSWEGTAQGRIAGGSYGASGAVTASITGGTNTTIEFNTGTVALVMLEKGAVATPFEHRPYGTELALCQRYYYRIAPGASAKYLGISGYCSDTVTAFPSGVFPVPMRTAPTALEQSGTASDYAIYHSGTSTVCSALPTFAGGTTNTTFALVTNTAGGLTQGRGAFLASNSANAYLGWSAEL